MDSPVLVGVAWRIWRSGDVDSPVLLGVAWRIWRSGDVDSPVLLGEAWRMKLCAAPDVVTMGGGVALWKRRIEETMRPNRSNVEMML